MREHVALENEAPVDTPQLNVQPAKKRKNTKNVTSAPRPTGRILRLRLKANLN